MIHIFNYNKILINPALDFLFFFSFFFLLSSEKKGIHKNILTNIFSQSSYSDISNFDPEFTDEMVSSSIYWTQEHSIVNASVMEADDAFVGFSYAPPSDDAFQ